MYWAFIRNDHTEYDLDIYSHPPPDLCHNYVSEIFYMWKG